MAIRPTFVDEIPFYYETYLAPIIFQFYATDLANRIKIGPRGMVLETAAGTGLATRVIRHKIPGDALFYVTDISDDMLETANKLIDSNKETFFHSANAMDLPFENGIFDAVCCQFSMMFFEDKLKAMKEALRVLKPGGVFTFNTWDSLAHNELAHTVDKAVRECLPTGSPSLYQVPYGSFDTDKIMTLLHESGFNSVQYQKVPGTSIAKDASDVSNGYILGTPARIFIEKYAPGTLNNVLSHAEKAVAQNFGSQNISAKMQAIVFQAQKAE